jgi:hypothetical protein
VGEDHAAHSNHDGPPGDRPGRKELAMAGSQQRPTEDVEVHGRRFPDDETSGDDRGTRNPDDTEGHGWRFSQDTEATDDRSFRHPDDTEGHIMRFEQDAEAVDEDQATDDTEGHGWRL